MRAVKSSYFLRYLLASPCAKDTQCSYRNAWYYHNEHGFYKEDRSLFSCHFNVIDNMVDNQHIRNWCIHFTQNFSEPGTTTRTQGNRRSRLAASLLHSLPRTTRSITPVSTFACRLKLDSIEMANQLLYYVACMSRLGSTI